MKPNPIKILVNESRNQAKSNRSPAEGQMKAKESQKGAKPKPEASQPPPQPALEAGQLRKPAARLPWEYEAGVKGSTLMDGFLLAQAMSS